VVYQVTLSYLFFFAFSLLFVEIFDNLPIFENKFIVVITLGDHTKDQNQNKTNKLETDKS
jgi:hypothetical protein